MYVTECVCDSLLKELLLIFYKAKAHTGTLYGFFGFKINLT